MKSEVDPGPKTSETKYRLKTAGTNLQRLKFRRKNIGCVTLSSMLNGRTLVGKWTEKDE